MEEEQDVPNRRSYDARITSIQLQITQLAKDFARLEDIIRYRNDKVDAFVDGFTEADPRNPGVFMRIDRLEGDVRRYKAMLAWVGGILTALIIAVGIKWTTEFLPSGQIPTSSATRH
jgi:hypothetical protein